MVTDPSRPTTTKTRIVAQGSLRFPQQLARIDHLDRRPLDEGVEREVVAKLTAIAPQADAILVSDYRTGLMTPAAVEACLRLAEEHHKLITVDSQGDLYKNTKASPLSSAITGRQRRPWAAHCRARKTLEGR